MASTAQTKKPRKITLDMVLASTSLTRSSKETADAYLQRVTHLHLQMKRIKVIEGLEQCTNLKVLYLYDNQIELIQNLGFSGNLSYLYLHNNLLRSLPETLPMPNLKKIYLDDNEIQSVGGLHLCIKLEELHIARQRLPSYTSLQFEPGALNPLSSSLQVLEISGNGISLLAPFNVLFNLRKLYCQDNKVIDLAEVEVIVALPRLEEANFVGNPCCSLFKYRDTTIGASGDSFQMLDEIPIPKHQQIAIRGLMVHRRKIGAMSRFQQAVGGMEGSQYDGGDGGSQYGEYQSQSMSQADMFQGTVDGEGSMVHE
ncbi:hypothetical protein B484DRAFT_448752 [Ochromonadaceae sp. CCMP2298]|nr:hypothetical protein B484DRAFT_448752 [Ochromonadaceae sp. CCMP2298]